MVLFKDLLLRNSFLWKKLSHIVKILRKITNLKRRDYYYTIYNFKSLRKIYLKHRE